MWSGRTRRRAEKRIRILNQAKKLAETTFEDHARHRYGLRPAMLDLLAWDRRSSGRTREYRAVKTPIQLDVAGDLRDLPDPLGPTYIESCRRVSPTARANAHAKNIRVSLKDAQRFNWP